MWEHFPLLPHLAQCFGCKTKPEEQPWHTVAMTYVATVHLRAPLATLSSFDQRVAAESLCHCVCKGGCVSMKPPFSRDEGRGCFKGLPSIECQSCLTLEQTTFCKQDNCKARVTAFAHTYACSAHICAKKITIIYSHIHIRIQALTRSHTQILTYTLIPYILIPTHRDIFSWMCVYALYVTCIYYIQTYIHDL